MKSSCIMHQTDSRMVLLRQDYLDICDGNRTEAKLLAVFEYWTNAKHVMAEENHVRNEQLASHGLEPEHPTEMWIYKTYDNLLDDLMGDVTRNKLAEALAALKEKGFLRTRNNPRYSWDRTVQYSLAVKVVNQALQALLIPSIVYLGTINNPPSNDQSSSMGRTIPEITSEITSAENTDNKGEQHSASPSDKTPSYQEQALLALDNPQPRKEKSSFSAQGFNALDLDPGAIGEKSAQPFFAPRDPPEPRTLKDWRNLLEEAKNESERIAILVRFVRVMNPAEIEEMEARAANPFSRIGGMVKGTTTQRGMGSCKNALKYLWMASGYEAEKIIEYAQVLYRTSRRNNKPVPRGPREL